MFHSVLVANRGEIACRIFRTARAMGIKTVAVFSTADAKAKHVREADVAVSIGAAPAGESYLRGEKIIAAAIESGVQAIHPGYGFLSENPEFAEAVMKAGLIWIGPTPAAIRAMGLKDEAKRIAIAASVPVLAGYQGEDQSEKRLLKAAKEIGFPVLIKAVAGGGGRGIREVKSADEFKAQLDSAQREAKAAFGNEVVLIEKLVERPRHIEVQVFGDKHGNIVHLYERDCSLQRRRQKVIEEAPAPGMTEEVRAAMTDAAVKLARAVDYENAGTVEFIVDGNGPLREDGFWFLEMNTRLQVEHPVTEAITGLDLVEWQFRVAAGEELPLRQKDIAIHGHAIEARICAEDPREGFRPSVGRLEHCRWPQQLRVDVDYHYAIRVDCGFDEGDVIPSAYDSMIGKVIAWSRDDAASDSAELDRAGALQLLREKVAELEIFGCVTNAHFLVRCMDEEGAFARGAAHVGLIGEQLDTLIDTRASRDRAFAALISGRQWGRRKEGSVWSQPDGWRLNAPSRVEWRLECDGVPIEAREDAGEFLVDGRRVEPNERFARRSLTIMRGADAIVFAEGAAFRFSPLGASAEHQGLEAGDEIKAPLPGKIAAITAKPGARVKKGDVLVTLEAMKMEHGLKAPRDGVIAEIAATEGEQVKEGALLVRLEGEG